MENRGTSAPGSGGINEFDSERQKALDVITSAFATGQLSLEEYEVRAEKIQKANSIKDIAGQTADLPQQQMPREKSGMQNVEQRNGSPEFIACVMGDRKMAGDWLNSDSATSITLMGSTTLDLRNTAIPPGQLKINAIAIMGEIRILVPQGLPVKMSAIPFMGETHIHNSVEQRIDRKNPWVEVSGLALMGSIIVKSV